MATVVLLPGACHGGWWFEPLVRRLGELGHEARAVTLAGVGERADELTGRVTLDSHVAETAELVAAEAAEQVVLVGHSYAGSVITGVADRIPARVGALLYLDAFVPEDGDSCWSMTNDEQRRWYIEGAGRTGLAVDPLPFFDSRATPHPLATLLQRSRLSGAWRSIPIKHYAARHRRSGCPCRRSYRPPSGCVATRAGPCTTSPSGTTSWSTGRNWCWI